MDPVVFNIIIYILAAGSSVLMLLYLRKHIRQQTEIKHYQGLQEIVIPLIRELRSKQHDYKNQLQALSCLVQQQEEGRVAAYLREISREPDAYSDFLKVDNPVLGAHLHVKKNAAREKGVDFKVIGMQAGATYPLKEFELVAMLGNLLDNALEAAPAGGEILLELGRDERGSYVKVENTCTAADTSKLFQWGASSKGSGRGIGLYNVKKLVARYHGTISVELSEGKIRFKILFPK